MERLELEYLQPNKARNFTYYTIPKPLADNPEFDSVEMEAKLLYCQMVERVALSAQNADEFTDEQGRLYIIFSIEEIMQLRRCSKPTAVKWVNQLDSIGLIEKKRRGQGKPTIIYVKDFSSLKELPAQKTDCAEEEKINCETQGENAPDSRSKECLPLEVKDVYFKKSKSFTSRSKKSLPLEVKDFYPIEKDLREQDLNNLSLLPTPSDIPVEEWTEEDITMLEDEVKQQISFDVLLEKGCSDEQLTEIVRQIVSALCCTDNTLKLGGKSYPAGLVKTRMRQLDCECVEFALDTLMQAKDIKNPRAYLFAVLLNAPISVATAAQVEFNAGQDKRKPNYNIDEVERMSFFNLPPGI